MAAYVCKRCRMSFRVETAPTLKTERLRCAVPGCGRSFWSSLVKGKAYAVVGIEPSKYLPDEADGEADS